MNFFSKTIGCALLVGTATVAQAASIIDGPSCQSGTFASYSGSGYSCSLGVLQLFNFALYTLDENDYATAADSQLLNTITIEPIWNFDTGKASLSMQGWSSLGVDANNTAAWLIRYTVDPPPVVGGETMELDPPFGFILGTQDYCENGTFVEGFCSSERGGRTGFSIGSPANLIFESPLVTLDTLTKIRLNPNLDTASGFDGIVFGVQTVSPVPEPGAWLLGASGLAALARLRQRNKQARG